MHIYTQQIIETVQSMSEGLKPRETTLKLIRDFAYTYRVKNGEAYCLN